MGKTKSRFPNNMPADTWGAWMEDWQDLAKEFGRKRFEFAVRRCWTEILFFPKPAEIRERIPPNMDGANEVTREMDELRRRRDNGEKFYSLADLAKEFNKMQDSKKVPE